MFISVRPLPPLPPLPSQTKLLVEAGANVLLADRWGLSPLDDARRAQAMPVIAFLEPLVLEVGTGHALSDASSTSWVDAGYATACRMQVVGTGS